MQPEFKIEEHSFVDTIVAYAQTVTDSDTVNYMVNLATRPGTRTRRSHDALENVRQRITSDYYSGIYGPGDVSLTLDFTDREYHSDYRDPVGTWMIFYSDYGYLRIDAEFLLFYRPLLEKLKPFFDGDEELFDWYASYSWKTAAEFDPRPLPLRKEKLYFVINAGTSPMDCAELHPAIQQLGHAPWRFYAIARTPAQVYSDITEFVDGMAMSTAERTNCTYIFTPDTPSWRVREAMMMAAGAHAALPPDIIKALPLENLLHQFPHLPVKDANAGNIAFTQNVNSGIRNRQQVMKPGRFFRQAMPDATDQEVKDMTALFESQYKMYFFISHDEEDFAKVYTYGPNSCMGRDESKFGHLKVNGQFYHPARVYAHPENNIRIIWMECRGRIAARAVVNIKKMQYPTFYVCDWLHGVSDTFRDYLDEQGYAQVGDALYGEKLLRVSPDRNNRAIICPYIDSSNMGVEVYQDHLLIEGGSEANHETGCLEDHDVNGVQCYECEETFDEDDTVTTVDDERICYGCRDEHYTYAFIGANDTCDYVHNEDSDLYELTDVPSNRVRYCSHILLNNDHNFVDLDERFYDRQATLRDNAIETADAGYILRDDMEEHGYFDAGDGLAEYQNEWCVVDGALTQISSADLETLEETSADAEYPMLCAYITPEPQEEVA